MKKILLLACLSFGGIIYNTQSLMAQASEIDSNDIYIKEEVQDLNDITEVDEIYKETVNQYLNQCNPILAPQNKRWNTKTVNLWHFDKSNFNGTHTVNLLYGNSKFVFPLNHSETKVNSNFGWRHGRAHTGIDLNLKTGDYVSTCFSGVVRIASYTGGYGKCVVVRHYNGLETLYGHLSDLWVKPGDVITEGTIVGLGGSTGHSTGPHLHFEMRMFGMPLNPGKIIDSETKELKSNIIIVDNYYFTR